MGSFKNDLVLGVKKKLDRKGRADLNAFSISDRFREFYFSIKPGSKNNFLICDLHAKQKHSGFFVDLTWV